MSKHDLPPGPPNEKITGPIMPSGWAVMLIVAAVIAIIALAEWLTGW